MFVCLCVCSLSKEGRLIIMSIHQPRYSIFRLFDYLTLLSRGEIIYQGKAYGALSYFSTTLGVCVCVCVCVCVVCVCVFVCVCVCL